MDEELWFVSRQKYWPDGDLVVEIAQGGADYCNPDMLVALYKDLGEGKEYSDRLDAVKAAIAIRKAWNADLDDGKMCRIEVGFTYGATFPFNDEPTDEELMEWANG